MEHISKYLTKDIKLSSYEDKLFKSDLMFDDHMLVWFISGETKIIQAESTFSFKTGDIFLIPRNELATIINYPKNGLPHKTVVMHLSTERLKKFYEKTEHNKKTQPQQKIYRFSNHPLLESCLASLIPYFDVESEFPESLATLKIEEAINILRLIDPSIDSVLANFDVPGKIDLIDFMQRNFMFNMSLEKLGYLTGRSLSTFNRDFKKLFHTTPQKWLTDKRLELAHYYLTEKKKKPTEIYLEVGFEDLSHFSFIFKKKYGVSPNRLPLNSQ
ncbi:MULTISPECIES: AraC family transcriptional regulator [unclassified Pedobacter]|uniref:helix-turn-helix domain-containing protein n=1 Tax=unclassified Pedobacter TaxID=2628915 RepID=UPI001DB4D4B6|nr:MULTISPECIES: AraC family transcriptional regulator [unclassified Pedobacter]CAH0132306.1 Exoenzyme S synthesis regulatory protein ExsA [Pedobacter sp. Bi126]CAH0226051.1 Exoenzyme S synthesis regulatory protein ExsA [Pedobacter sp. Bi36]